MSFKIAAVGIGIAVISVGCTGSVKPKPDPIGQRASAQPIRPSKEARRWLASVAERSSEYSAAFDTGCSTGYETFCTDLHSADGQGNLDLRTSDGVLPVRFGENEAGFDYAYLFYQQAKLDARERLPADFRARLEKAGYFEKLKEMLAGSGSKPDRLGMLARGARASEISTLWTLAVEETALERFDKVHPGFSKKDPAPRAEEVEYGEFKDKFAGEIFTAFWESHPRWVKLKADFELLRSEYIAMLGELEAIPADVKKDWIELIRTVTLVPPGGDMGNGSDGDCGTTTVNAYYMPSTHRITVCGGLLGGSEVIGVLAHEISHALDPNSMAMRYVQRSDYAGELRSIWRTSCEKAPIRECPEAWVSLRDRKDRFGKAFDGFELPAQKFLSCLQYKESELQPGPDPETLKKAAKGMSRQYAAFYADRGRFLRLIKPTVPDKRGKPEENASYLNVCSTHDPKDYNFSPTDAVLLAYTMEFVCDKSQEPEAVRMKKSIEAAIAFQRDILEKSIPFNGRFSDDSWMAEQGHSESVGERFADAMGFRVYARLLAKMPNVEDRRRHFLSNVSLFCDPPSLTREFPEEAQAEKYFSFEPHSDGKQRRMESMVPAIREALGCAKDYEAKECTL